MIEILFHIILAAAQYAIPSSTGKIANIVLSATCGTNGSSSYPSLVTVTSGCGNVGSTTAPGTFTTLASCNTSLTPGTTYELSTNIGGSQSTQCLGGTGKNVVYLNGHTVTGYGYWNASSNMSGFRIYGGTINCNLDIGTLATSPGCIVINDNTSTSWNPAIQFDHLTIHNASTTANNNPHTIMVATSSNLSAPTQPNVIFQNIDSTPATNLTTTRITNLQVTTQGGAWVQASYNKILCPSTASTCQGVVVYGSAKLEYFNNYGINQQMANGTGDSPRQALCDTFPVVVGVGTYQCDIHDNLFDAYDGRAVRERDGVAIATHIWNNVVNHVTPCTACGGTSAAFHLGNPDSGNDPGTALVEDNQITLDTNGTSYGGLPFLVADTSGSNWKLQHNSITCPGGQTCPNNPYVNLRNVNGTGGQQLTVWTMTYNGTISTPQNNVEASGTLNLCNAGTSSGAGTVNINNGICGSLP